MPVCVAVIIMGSTVTFMAAGVTALAKFLTDYMTNELPIDPTSD